MQVLAAIWGPLALLDVILALSLFAWGVAYITQGQHQSQKILPQFGVFLTGGKHLHSYKKSYLRLGQMQIWLSFLFFI
jgi:hypothetical protein